MINMTITMTKLFFHFKANKNSHKNEIDSENGMPNNGFKSINSESYKAINYAGRYAG